MPPPVEEEVHRFLELLGRSADRAALPRLDPDPEPEDIARHLELLGTAAEAVRLRPGDLRHLEGPALLRLKDGSWTAARVPRSRRDRRRLEDRLDGPAVVSPASLSPGRSLRGLASAAFHDQKRLLAGVAAASLGVVGLSLLPPWLIYLAVGEAMDGTSRPYLHWIALGVLAVALFQAWAGLLRERAVLALDSRLELALGRGFLGHLLELPFPFLHRKTVGDFLQAFNALDAFRVLLTAKAPAAALDAATALVYLALAGAALPALAAGLVLVGATALGVARLSASAQGRFRAEEVAARSRENGFLIELVQGIASVKAGGVERRAAALWKRHLLRELAASLKRMRLASLSDASQQVLRVGAPLLALGWGGASVVQGRLSAASLMMLLAAVTGFVGSVSGLAASYTQLAASRPELDRVREILGQERQSVRRRPMPALREPVVMEDVWFRHREEGPWVLEGYSLRVPPGEKVRLVGPSGCGKTTLLRLLAGFYVPQRGRVRVEGTDPSVGGPAFLYLPQSVLLYGGTVLENLRILSGQAPRERLLAAARETGLADWIDTLPMGFDTLLPPGAGSLSGGQRQLVALTAAAASAAPLVLLDEPLSNLDPASQVRALSAGGLQGKTLIYASHEESVRSGQGHDRCVVVGRDLWQNDGKEHSS